MYDNYMTEFFNTIAMCAPCSVQLTREVPVLNAPEVVPVLVAVFEAQNKSRLHRWLGESYIDREKLVTLSARAGAYEPLKAVKEHVTTMPSKYKLIMYL